jgi:periplasmic protein TonB
MIDITSQEIERPKLPTINVIEEIEIVNDDIKIEDQIEIQSIEIGENDTINFEIYTEKETSTEMFPFYLVEIKPKFMDGKDATLINWITNNTVFPEICVESNISGTVWISFIISETGRVVNVELLRGVNDLLDKEAIKCIKNMPDWVPGNQAGKNVCVPYQLPVKFTIY